MQTIFQRKDFCTTSNIFFPFFPNNEFWWIDWGWDLLWHDSFCTLTFLVAYSSSLLVVSGKKVKKKSLGSRFWNVHTRMQYLCWVQWVYGFIWWIVLCTGGWLEQWLPDQCVSSSDGTQLLVYLSTGHLTLIKWLNRVRKLLNHVSD